MVKVLTVVFTVVISILGFENIEYPDDLEYSTITSQTPTMPKHLSSIIDKSTPNPTKIVRVTDYVEEWDWYPKTEYAKIQPWNADQTIYKFYSVSIYNATTHKLIRRLPGSDIYPSYWSNIDPDIMYGIKESGDFRIYSVEKDTTTTVAHITNRDGKDYEVVKMGPGEGNFDKSDKYVALVAKNGQDMDVVIFNMQEYKTVHIETFNGAWGDDKSAPKYVDWVSVSQSGNFVGIMWNHNTTSETNPYKNHYGVEIYNTLDMNYLRRITKYGNHGDFGYAQDGDEVLVQFWGETGTLNMFYLNREERVVLTDNPDFNSGGGHISCRNLKRPGWAYVTQKGTPAQLVAVKLDKSGIVAYFGHHYSSNATYTKSPMAVPSRDGKKVMYKSDFGDSTNPDEVYVFEAYRDNGSSAIENSKIVNSTISKVSVKLLNSILEISNCNNISKISIFSTRGVLVKSLSLKGDSSQKIEMVNMPKGVYLVKIRDIEKQSQTYKVVKR